MVLFGSGILRRIFTTTYTPDPVLRTFLERAQSQHSSAAEVTVAVLDAAESARLCGVPLAKRGLQPVYLKVTNRDSVPLRLQVVNIDPSYFTPLEAAGVNHYSLLKRLSAFGILGWFLLPLVLLILPIKLITAYRANGRMDECFRSLAFRLRPIMPGQASEGFIFTRLDAGTKVVHVVLHAMSAPAEAARIDAEIEKESDGGGNRPAASLAPAAEFAFSIPVPGIAVDYHRRDFQ